MKFNKKSFNLMKMAGAVVGGAAADLVDGSIAISDDADNNEYIKAGIFAAVGAALGVFVKGDLLGGMGDGLIGVAGYKLAHTAMNRSSSSTTNVTKTSGMGELPSQLAIGAALPDENTWLASRQAISATEDATPSATAEKQNVL